MNSGNPPSRTDAVSHFRRNAHLAVVALLAAFSAASSWAAVPNRLRADAALTERTELPQQVSHRVNTATALGHLSGDTALPTMSLVLSPTAAQNAALDQLLAAQQDPASPSYHKWLTPEQFGAQFGVSQSDLQVMQKWLTSQGFQVLGVVPSHNQIQFSGTAALVESAFGTTMGRFRGADQEFFENSSTVKVPTAFEGVIAGITGLSSFRMHANSLRARPRPALTGTSNGAVVHELVPYDVRAIYNVSGLTGSGYSGTGVKIGVIGQSAVDTTQLANFQTLTGQTIKSPNLVLVPQTGVSTLYSGDEGESEADLEYAGGVAPGATLYFIYSGSSTTADVITALEYAIGNNIAQILSLSYGGCEVSYSSSFSSVEIYLRQANAQGQTIVVASGDSGAAGCDVSSATSAQDGLQVSYPASSPSVTAIGGTTLNDNASFGNYWSSSNNSQLGSALGYIPEVAWNDTSPTLGLSSTGGGASRLFSKPNWQTGTGVPADNARDIPDISFSASNAHDPYVICSADSSLTQTTSSGTTVTGACTTAKLGSFAFGGTSLPTPSFAGMLAIAEQANGGGALGNINPTLYRLAASKPAIFHDVTSGSNSVPCLSGTLNCTGGTLGYNAGAGYDQVTGLGSMDIGQFSSGLAAVTSASARVASVSLSITSTTSTTTTFTATVTSTGSSNAPTGTVSFSIDGGASQLTGGLVSTAGASGGALSFTLTNSSLSAGTHTLTATYSGDGNYGVAASSLSFTAGAATGAFSVAASPSTLTVVSGQTGNVTLNFTSASGFSGLLTYTINVATGSATPNIGCFTGRNDLSLAPNATVPLGIVFHTASADCTSAGSRISVGSAASVKAGLAPAPHLYTSTTAPFLAFVLGGGLLGGVAMRRRKPWMTGLLAIAFTAASAGLVGCGSGGASLGAASTTTAKGTYTLVVTATSATNSALTTTTNLTLVVQ